MKKVAIVLLIATFACSVYSQTVKSSFVSFKSLKSDRTIVRAHTPTEIIASVFSGSDNLEKFLFIKDSMIHTYVTLPQGYVINDFEIFHDTIYFCGTNHNLNCGYIGILGIPLSMQSVGGFKSQNIAEVSTLTKLVVFDRPDEPSKIGVVAIGKPVDNNYKSSVVHLNNYLQSYWKYTVGHTNHEVITDISLCGNDELITIGKVNPPVSNSGLVIYTPKLYIRQYKRSMVFGTGMEEIVYNFQSVRELYPNEDYHVIGTTPNHVTVASVEFYPTPGHSFQPKRYCLNVRTIDVSTLQMSNIQYITANPGTIKDLEYFPNSQNLSVVMVDTNGLGNVIFANLNKTANYNTYKLTKDATIFNSITRYDDDYFMVASLKANSLLNPACFLQENFNYFKESNCSVDEVTDAEVTTVSPIPYRDSIPFSTRIYNVNFEPKFLGVYKTDLTIECTSYYKKEED